jgi:hypothetical protein
MTQPTVDDKDIDLAEIESRRSFLRTVLWAGVIVFVVTVGAIVIVVTENKGDALSRVVITLTPTIASAVGIVTTAILNGRLRNDQHGIKTSLATVSDKVSTVEHQTNGLMSPRIEAAVTKVLNNPDIQHNVAGKLADVLIAKAAPVVPSAHSPAQAKPAHSIEAPTQSDVTGSTDNPASDGGTPAT